MAVAIFVAKVMDILKQQAPIYKVSAMLVSCRISLVNKSSFYIAPRGFCTKWDATTIRYCAKCIFKQTRVLVQTEWLCATMEKKLIYTLQKLWRYPIAILHRVKLGRGENNRDYCMYNYYLNERMVVSAVDTVEAIMLQQRHG